MVKPIINHPEIEVYEIGFTTWFPYHLQLPAFALVPPAALGSLGPGTARSGGSREPVRLPAFLGATDRVPALIGNRGGLSGGVFINQTMFEKKQIPSYVYNCIHTCAHVFVYIYICVCVCVSTWTCDFIFCRFFALADVGTKPMVYGVYMEFIEVSLEDKLPTIWADGKAGVGRVREEKGRRKKVREEKELEERRSRCAKR